MEHWHNKYYDIAAESDVGERSENQDAYGINISEHDAAIVVCDGMGGFEGGKAAGQLAVSEMLRLCRHIEDSEQNYGNALTYAMDVADVKISNLQSSQGRKMHAGATCVTVILKKRGMYCLSVGDSRLYIYRKGRMAQLTRDHTVALKAENDYRNGNMTYDEYVKAAKDKSTLCSYLGLGGIEIYDVNNEIYKLQKEDILIISSDGLYKSLDINAMKKIIEKYSDAETIAHKLINSAADYARGHNQDNTTVAVCRIK